jgi:hypothetical protein
VCRGKAFRVAPAPGDAPILAQDDYRADAGLTDRRLCPGPRRWLHLARGTLCTLAVVTLDGQRQLFRYAAESIPESIRIAEEHLAGRIGEVDCGALVYDGFVTPDDGRRSDALMVELVGPGGVRMGRFAQPYWPARRVGLPLFGRAFALAGRPIIDRSIESDDPETAIYRGAREHPFGARLLRSLPG